MDNQQTFESRGAASATVEWVHISATYAGQRIDNYLLAHWKGVPRSVIYRLVRRGEVRVNKGRVAPSYRLATGDALRLPPVRRAAVTAPVVPSMAQQHRLEQAVLYEDERVLVLNKPAGLAVHGGSGISAGVIEILRQLRPTAELELAHRLDRDTSGCLVISKRRSTLRWLHEQLRTGQMKKRYQALLIGQLPRRQVRVDAPLHKYQLRSGERMVTVDAQQGKAALTIFIPQQRWAAVTLADIQLETGRTHQIRVHAAHIGHPVAGDDKYGDAVANAQLRSAGLTRLFLHAAHIELQIQPESPPVTVTAPLPEALALVVAQLQRH